MILFGQDAASLNNLNDLVEPQIDLGVWTFGWILFLVVWAPIVIVMAFRLVKTWRDNAYRRSALNELDQIRGQLSNPNPSVAEVIGKLNPLIKRVALAGWGRTQVASMHGREWLEFLNHTTPEPLFSDEQLELLTDSAYSTRLRADLKGQHLIQIIDQAEKWIRNHQTDLGNQTVGEASA